MPQQRPWSPVSAGCPGFSVPRGGTSSLSQPKKASAKSQDGPKSLPGSLPALDPAH